jgi:DNA topoisomerase II
MAIYSLTNERVAKLLAQRGAKEQELDNLLKMTAKEIWTRDLDDISDAWQDVLERDALAAKADHSSKKKRPTSKFAKASRKRPSDGADGDYAERKPKAVKQKSNSSPGQSKITSFISQPPAAREIHTAAFTSVNKTGADASETTKKKEISKITPIISLDDDDEFESLVKGIRPEEKPTTIDLLSPQTAMKAKKTFTIPGIRKASTIAGSKPRVVSKSKAPKRKVESDDEDDSFAFMTNEKPSLPVGEIERRPARAAASKAKAIVLTSDDVYDESDDEEEYEV